MVEDDGIVDNTPVALKLMITNKNPEVLRRHVIDQVCIYGYTHVYMWIPLCMGYFTQIFT
jgi:hypothetical protein